MGDDLEPARAYGPYDLIIDSVGGKTLESALSLLAPGATCVMLGWSASPEAKATIDLRNLIMTGGMPLTTLDGQVFNNHARYLARLAQMVAEQQLRTSIEVEASWHDIGDIAQRLLQRQFTGKAVLHLA
ncbi:hypothetical protein KSB_60430 [Ktedonobacter robiniae]|uniref:Alcohol dehydrogenase-like C-terminal domain-containing protein n=1 Tax=Ktedonobacter robiniae TaxID=2778365 RepID=A0ABQ3UXS1_9CHLR|nr:hypothetical protein KSB_60430 [Ktedonobacter robiniae]